MPEEVKQSEIKFSEEELDKIQNIQKSYAETTNKFGQLSLAKIRLNQQEESLDKEHNVLQETFSKIQDEEQLFLDGITEKYGQGSLNPETGVFTPNKSE